MIPNGNLITSISWDEIINGLILASFEMCNFGLKDKKNFSLAMQIHDIPYYIKWAGIDKHRYSYAGEVFCKVK